MSGHSWTPLDLLAAGEGPPTLPAIGGVCYPGLRHLLIGEPESLKTWLALVLVALEVGVGHTVAYIDFESTPREMLARLRALGLTDDQIHEHVLYVQPSEALGDAQALADLRNLIADRRPSLVVVDAMIGALALHGLSPNDAVDIEMLHRVLIDPLAEHGAAIVIIDHAVKDVDNRGRWATGSERKIGRVDVALLVETKVPFGRGRTGRAAISVSKDRPGYLARPRAAELELISDPDTGAITFTLSPCQSTPGEATAFRPTNLMEKVSRFLEGQPAAVSRHNVEQEVAGRAASKRTAIDLLVAEGFVTETTGANRARLVASVRPYRESDDAGSSSSSGFVPGSSRTNPAGPSGSSRLAPPPKGGDERTNQGAAVHDLRPRT